MYKNKYMYGLKIAGKDQVSFGPGSTHTDGSQNYLEHCHRLLASLKEPAHRLLASLKEPAHTTGLSMLVGDTKHGSR